MITTKGIIFKSIKYGESSLILHIYTEELGLKSYIVSGVRKGKSKIQSGLLQVMGLVEIVAYNKSGDQISRIKEVKADEFYTGIPFDIIRSSIGLFFIEVCRNSIKEKEQNRELFEFLRTSLLNVDRSSGHFGLIPHYLLLKLANHLGFGLDLDYVDGHSYFNLAEGRMIGDFGKMYSLSDSDSFILREIQGVAWSALGDIKITKKDRAKLLQDLLKYYEIHVENFNELKSLPILSSVLNGI